MRHRSLKTFTLVSLTALALSGTAVLTSAPAEAQVRGGYALDDDDDGFDRPRVQRRVVDDDFDRPRARHRVVIDDEQDEPRIQRRLVERRIVERRIVEPVVERQIVERLPVVRQVIQPVVERRIVEPRPVVRQVVERPIVRPVVERRVVRPVVEERRIVRVAAPVEECQTVVTRRTNAFGDRVVTRSRTCD